MAQEDIDLFKAKESAFTGRFLLYFGAAVLFLAVAFFFGITFIPIPKENTRFADTILGFMGGTLVSSIINFYWGSSKQSKDKDNSIETLINKQSVEGEVSELVQGGNNVTVSPADGTKTIVTDQSTTIVSDDSTEGDDINAMPDPAHSDYMPDTSDDTDEKPEEIIG